uniref:Peptidase A1 domain-containing protein n=1 Tax=Kwoniella dejecticola CBS 10117 TaxID=1296121 RepID=A0A1A5ZZE6_9TREE|nr:uncharacterized protein I303_06737 [Kwoniella dejecticola CBS 10117]OBR83178.1 hypothetical protein I303_06737 [Kwoniella dejecticola CBS 10117]
MTKHDPNLGRHPDVAGAKRSAGFSDTARMVERAINLKMTPHTASRNLDRRQEEPTYSTTSSNNPYAFPEQQDSALSAVLNPTESPSTSSSASAVQTSIAADGNSWSTTFSWTDSWSDSSSTGYSQPSNQALVEETTSSMTSSGSNSPTPSATTSGNNPITTLDAEDTSKMGTIYTIDVMVNGVALSVHVDTGSSQFWAAHDRCQECKQNGMTTINTYLPESCGQDASTTTIYYAMGWVKGCHVNTSITLGEDTLQNYPVLAVFEAGGGVEKLGEYYSGLIGLGTEGSDDDGVPTVVTALYQQGAIQQPIVGFYLPRAGDNQESEITFGDPATSEHADESKMVNLARQGGDSGHYIVRMDSFVIGSTTVAQAADCYLDTGPFHVAPQHQILGYGLHLGDKVSKFRIEILYSKMTTGPVHL